MLILNQYFIQASDDKMAVTTIIVTKALNIMTATYRLNVKNQTKAE
jgi:hypothetical protein